jgi:hypothetical protein
LDDICIDWALCLVEIIIVFEIFCWIFLFVYWKIKF